MDAKTDKTERVVAVTIMYGNRWNFLSQTITSILKDAHVRRLIIVDNGSQNEKEIREGVAQYGNRVKVIRHEKNLGSAGGFSAGIAAAREEDADFVYLSDDDMIPEDGFVEKYVRARAVIGREDVVVCGHRIDIPGNSDVFRTPTPASLAGERTFFEIFSWKKIKKFAGLLFGFLRKRKRDAPFVPIVPIQGFVYGGSFIPMDAVRKAPLPDVSLFLYGDDIAYAWGIERLGYYCYASATPVISDIDITFPVSHIYGLFDEITPAWKVFYRIRNMVILSRQYSTQTKFTLLVSVILWIIGLSLLGLLRKGPTLFYIRRAHLIIDAVLCGYFTKKKSHRDAEI